jgi:hypothetical protein
VTNPTTFRRAFVDRTRGVVCVEPAPNRLVYLPGSYNPETLLQRVSAARYIDLDKWRPYPPVPD